MVSLVGLHILMDSIIHHILEALAILHILEVLAILHILEVLAILHTLELAFKHNLDYTRVVVAIKDILKEEHILEVEHFGIAMAGPELVDTDLVGILMVVLTDINPAFVVLGVDTDLMDSPEVVGTVLMDSPEVVGTVLMGSLVAFGYLDFLLPYSIFL